VRAFVADDASGQGISLATSLGDFDPESAGREAGRIARMARSPEPGQPGKYRVILGPSIFANLLNRVGDSASAYTVDLGLSFFHDSVKQKVASDIFNLHDNSQLPNGPESRTLDDEGSPTQNIPLIKNGVLQTYLHASYTAAKYKAPLTGSAEFEGGIAGIVPAPRNLVVDNGENSLDDLIDKVHDGLYITNNWYTRFQNYRTGDFSTILRDGVFEIKNGKLSRPLKGLRLSDNMIRILKAIERLSKERHWIKWWEVETPTLTPFALVGDVGITTANK
jgi:PmbA protein